MCSDEVCVFVPHWVALPRSCTVDDAHVIRLPFNSKIVRLIFVILKKKCTPLPYIHSRRMRTGAWMFSVPHRRDKNHELMRNALVLKEVFAVAKYLDWKNLLDVVACMHIRNALL